MTSRPRIVSTRRSPISDWVTLVENSVAGADSEEAALYHSFDLADYVSIFAITSDGRVPLVRQFRPAVDRVSLEFPGGMLEPDELPEQCAVRELAEETGFVATDVSSLGTFLPDTGRLGNRVCAFLARNVMPIPSWTPEPGVTPLVVTLDELYKCARAGTFENGPHLAMLGLAILRGLVDPASEQGKSR